MLLQHIHSHVTRKFPDSQHITVGGLFFLRFICPSIVNPGKYKIIDGKFLRIFITFCD